MIKLLLYKWFGLDPVTVCPACEILREQLTGSERERRELLQRLLDKDKSEPPPTQSTETLKAITPPFVPWRVKQQLLEQEDKKRAQIMKDRSKEIADLEKEMGVVSDPNHLDPVT